MDRHEGRGRTTFRGTDERHRVTTLELFFDLVFVFAITEVTAFMADDLSTRQILRGVVLLALLWWAWCSYAWLGNQARADEGPIRAAMVAAMGGMFVVALAVPAAWGDQGRGLSAPLALAVALGVVRLVHLAVYYAAALEHPELRRQVTIMAVPVTVAAGLLLVGALVGGPGQTALWLLALVADYGGVYAAGGSGWQVASTAHFAERHGLIIIVALGESIVAIGVGIGDLPLTWPVLIAAALGLGVSVALWWLHFDMTALVAERALAARTGADRVALARDSYTYLHFPMVAGIVFLAVGLKKVLSYVAGGAEHSLSDPVTGIGLWALYGGVCLYLLGHIAFRLRNVGSVNWARLAVAVGLLALLPLATVLPALATLGVLAAVLAGLVAVEAIVYAEARASVRSADQHAG